jgi:hypothetical protein
LLKRRYEEISKRKINCLNEERVSFYFSEISETLPANFRQAMIFGSFHQGKEQEYWGGETKSPNYLNEISNVI